MWLLRGLYFTCKGLQNSQANKDVELAVAFTTAYGESLKQFHNFVVKGIFAVRLLNLTSINIDPRLVSSWQ